MSNSIINELINLGLNEKEAKIYLALIENGEMTVSELSTTTKIQRTSLYDILPPFIHAGFISKVPDEKKQRYQAEPPENIALILESRAKKLEQQAKKANKLALVLQQQGIQSEVKPKISLYEGEQQLKTLYDTTLTCQSFIRSFLSADTLEAFDAEYINKYFERRTKNEIHIRGILGNSELSREYKQKSKKYLRKIRLVPSEKMNIVPEIYLYDDTIAIFSLREKLGISITSHDITQAFIKLYDLAWERAANYDSEITMSKTKKP